MRSALSIFSDRRQIDDLDDLPQLLAWYRADDLSASPISTWPNKASALDGGSNRRDLTNSGTSRPTLLTSNLCQRNMVRFDGSNDDLFARSATAFTTSPQYKPVTALLVARVQAWSSGKVLLDLCNNTGPLLWMSGSSPTLSAGFGKTGTQVTTPNVPVGQACVVAVCWAGAHSYLAVNGNVSYGAMVPGPTGTEPLTYCTLGGVNGGTQNAQIDVGELALWEGIIPYTWMAQVIRSLRTRYGIGLFDSFTRADSATAPGSLESGEPWEANGVWGISSNQLYHPVSLTGVANRCLVDTGLADIEAGITVAVRDATSGRRQRFAFRQDRAGLGWFVEANGSGAWTLRRGTATATTDLLTGPASASGDRITVTAVGRRITCYINGVTFGSVEDAFNQNATLCGTSENGAPFTTRYDAFFARPPSLCGAIV